MSFDDRSRSLAATSGCAVQDASSAQMLFQFSERREVFYSAISPTERRTMASCSLQLSGYPFTISGQDCRDVREVQKRS